MLERNKRYKSAIATGEGMRLVEHEIVGTSVIQEELDDRALRPGDGTIDNCLWLISRLEAGIAKCVTYIGDATIVRSEQIGSVIADFTCYAMS